MFWQSRQDIVIMTALPKKRMFTNSEALTAESFSYLFGLYAYLNWAEKSMGAEGTLKRKADSLQNILDWIPSLYFFFFFFLINWRCLTAIFITLTSVRIRNESQCSPHGLCLFRVNPGLEPTSGDRSQPQPPSVAPHHMGWTRTGSRIQMPVMPFYPSP